MCMVNNTYISGEYILACCFAVHVYLPGVACWDSDGLDEQPQGNRHATTGEEAGQYNAL